MNPARALVVGAVVCLAACARTPPEAADTPFRITASDSGYTLPDTLHAGLNHLFYENTGTEIHECMFIRLPDGMTPAAYVAQVDSGADFPAGALDCSGPGLTSPGESVEMWVPLEEGNYMVGCWFRDHMTTHRPATFVVHGAPATPVLPPHEDATLRMIDFRYELVGTIERGRRTLRFETVGPSMHEADIFRLDGGRSLENLREWMLNDQKGEPPGAAMGGVLDSHRLNRVTWLRHDFITAHYVFWCDMPMMQTAEKTDSLSPHVTHAEAGMFQEVDVD